VGRADGDVRNPVESADALNGARPGGPGPRNRHG
jgi:hypothetical protein